MAVLDITGALLTVVALLFLGLGGYLAAFLLLGPAGRRDPLALAVASLTAAIASGTAVALALGAGGLLRLPHALAVQATLVVGLLLHLRGHSPEDGPWAPLRLLLSRGAARLREHPALALITVHALGSEALRGLLRPPLAWDSLMYHLALATTWLQEGNLAPVFGRHPMSFYGYSPGNGELWLWWWLAPSHGELYANLAFLPQWLLLALAAGGVARELGARRSWPLAAFLVGLTPTVLRFAATQYVDIPLGAALAAAAFFALRWMKAGEAGPSWGDAALAGAALGLAAGTKVLGLAYALTFGVAALLLSRGWSRRRLAQAGLALLLLAALGSFFYLRNLAAGVGPLATVCASPTEGGSASAGTAFAGPRTLAGSFAAIAGEGELTDAFLGVSRPPSLELGIGPQALLLLPVVLLLPWLLPRGERRPGLLLWSQLGVQLLLWATVPFAVSGHLFANIRYLIGGLALAFAAAFAWAEGRKIDPRWLQLLALGLAVQSLLQLHAEMPREVRLALAWGDLLAAVLLFSGMARAWLGRYRRAVALGGVLALLFAVPPFVAFRLGDRGRAFAEEFTVHATPAPYFARAWDWLDTHAGASPVAVVMEPGNRFLYPAAGPRFERRVTYVNVNRANYREAGAFPACNPRVDPDPAAWLDNLEGEGILFVHLARQPGRDFPYELGWIEAHPERFAPRYEDPANRIYETRPRQPGGP